MKLSLFYLFRLSHYVYVSNMNFVSQYIHRKKELVKQKSIKELQNAWDKIVRTAMLVLFGAAVLWISIFLYVSFYYTYIPYITHVRPVHLQFNACDELKGVCTYPSAHVQLNKRNPLLMAGQPYKILMYLEMPESPINRDLGMFMVCAWLKDAGGEMINHSCRSAMLHYRSSLLISLKTLVQAPFLILGGHEEKQTLTLELYSDFQDDANHPITDIYVEVQSRFIQIYSAKIQINAALSGLRYTMFTWPLLSALLGISFNLLFIVFICSISWWQLYGPKEDLREIMGTFFFYRKLRGLVGSAENSFFFSKEDDENDVITFNDDESVSSSDGETEDSDEPTKQICRLQSLQVVPET